MSKIQQDVSWLDENASLCGVASRSFSAQRKAPGRAVGVEIHLRKSHNVSKDHIHFIWSCRVDLTGKAERELGFVEVKLHADYEIGEDHPDISEVEAQKFGDHVALRDVYPYLRQSIESLGTQAGFERIKIAPVEYFSHREGQDFGSAIHVEHRRPRPQIANQPVDKSQS